MAGTLGRVYGGDKTRIHVKDGGRKQMGEQVAAFLDMEMRNAAYERGDRTWEEAFGFGAHSPERQKLCPGCYMIVGYNMLVALAEQNGQSLTELANSMIGAFQHLKDNPAHPWTEEIEVILDHQKENEP